MPFQLVIIEVELNIGDSDSPGLNLTTIRCGHVMGLLPLELLFADRRRWIRGDDLGHPSKQLSVCTQHKRRRKSNVSLRTPLGFTLFLFSPCNDECLRHVVWIEKSFACFIAVLFRRSKDNYMTYGLLSKRARGMREGNDGKNMIKIKLTSYEGDPIST